MKRQKKWYSDFPKSGFFDGCFKTSQTNFVKFFRAIKNAHFHDGTQLPLCWLILIAFSSLCSNGRAVHSTGQSWWCQQVAEAHNEQFPFNSPKTHHNHVWRELYFWSPSRSLAFDNYRLLLIFSYFTHSSSAATIRFKLLIRSININIFWVNLTPKHRTIFFSLLFLNDSELSCCWWLVPPLFHDILRAGFVSTTEK